MGLSTVISSKYGKKIFLSKNANLTIIADYARIVVKKQVFKGYC